MRLSTVSFVMFLFLLISTTIFPQESPISTFEDLVITAEKNPKIRFEAMQLAEKLGLPLSIYLPEGIFIEALGIENGKPVYSLVTNLLHPFEGGQTVFFDHIVALYDLSKARVHYGKTNITNPALGYSTNTSNYNSEAVSFLMIPDWTADKVMSFNAFNGDLVNANFIPSNNPNLQSPKAAQLNKYGIITVSDQISDLVQKYDTTGVYLGFFAPAGGVNTAVLDNIRGHNYRPNGNLVVCVGSGGNQNSIAEFDESGNYIGQYITTSSGGLTSPFDIIFRTNDVLVTTSTASGVYRYDHSGAFQNVLVSGLSFAQQIQELSDKRLAVSEFSGTGSGVRIYDSAGVFLKLMNGVTGNRGVYQLGNGNFLVTNSTGVHELDSTSGVLVRTVVSGVSPQYITPFNPEQIIPVELISFSAKVVNGQVLLNWTSASEKNNLGFEIEKFFSDQWYKIGFVEGKGTTTNQSSYSFVDKNLKQGTFSYRLKQIDFDGSFSYSKAVDVSVELPNQFALEQNYPNPFNPTTTIEYRLPEKSNITLKIYDVLGREIVTLVNEEKEAGIYRIDFDASKLTSGVYYAQIYAGLFNQVKKMTLVK